MLRRYPVRRYPVRRCPVRRAGGADGGPEVFPDGLFEMKWIQFHRVYRMKKQKPIGKIRLVYKCFVVVEWLVFL